MKKWTLLFLLLLTASGSLLAQSKADKDKARELGSNAIELMEVGEIKKSLTLLEHASKLDPKNIDYPYEMAYAHYLDKDYSSAIKILSKLQKHKDVNDLVYQLLGNSYSISGNRSKAIKAYEAGLKKFSNSGRLYLERGNVELHIEEYNEAIRFYEKGILAEPNFPSNYYWTTLLFCGSDNKHWGLIYGEMFMNLERNTKRTATVSKLIYDTYKDNIEITSDTSMKVDFSSKVIHLRKDFDPENFKLPYGLIVYTPTFLVALALEKEIDIHALQRTRGSFVDAYYQSNHQKDYPLAILDYQRELEKQGHLEAYNYWILMQGDPEGFKQWKDENEEKWDAFVLWFNANQFQLDKKNRFDRSKF